MNILELNSEQAIHTGSIKRLKSWHLCGMWHKTDGHTWEMKDGTKNWWLLEYRITPKTIIILVV